MHILVITGMLGAGKTTVLLAAARALASAGRRLAIVENELGKVGVDGAAIGASLGRPSDGGGADGAGSLVIREIFGGCVCCAMGVSLLETLQQLKQTVQPDVVIVEPSGAASPGTIVQLLAAAERTLGVMSLVGVFDAERFGAISRVAAPVVEQTIAAAGLLIVTKVDRVGGLAAAQLAVELGQRSAGRRVLAVNATAPADQMRIAEAVTRLIELDQGHERTKSDEAHSHAACDGSHAGDGHPGAPCVVAEQFACDDADDAAADELVASVVAMLRSIGRSIEQSRGAVVGHLKCLIEADLSHRLVVRMTAAEGPADIAGELPDPCGRVRLTLNALAYNMDQRSLASAVGAARAEMMSPER